MFIDASAIVAILNREPGYEEIVKRIADQKRGRYVSSLVRFEATAALARSRSGATRPDFDQHDLAEQIVEAFCDNIEARNIDITRAIGQRANLAARTYGKMVGHAADLNLGDCFAYASAQAYNIRLIYKGDDFTKTDMAQVPKAPPPFVWQGEKPPNPHAVPTSRPGDAPDFGLPQRTASSDFLLAFRSGKCTHVLSATGDSLKTRMSRSCAGCTHIP